MNDDTRRLHLRFSLKRPEQRRAYEIISSIPPGKRMESLCSLINQKTHFYDLERHITSAVRKALVDYQPQTQHAKEESTSEEIREDIMDFLGSL
ncbi:MAG: hypothetical protein ACOYJC_03375 [Christensenellales bacterium]|jgi:hypothetical protein